MVGGQLEAVALVGLCLSLYAGQSQKNVYAVRSLKHEINRRLVLHTIWICTPVVQLSRVPLTRTVYISLLCSDWSIDGTICNHRTSLPPASFIVAFGWCTVPMHAVYVEYKNEEDSSYEAVCDISERMSCSRVRPSLLRTFQYNIYGGWIQNGYRRWYDSTALQLRPGSNLQLVVAR